MLPNLKLLRKEYHVSQQALADAIQVSQPSINKYENHNIEPEIAVLKRMADYFNTSIDFIVGHTTDRRRIEYTEVYRLNAYEADIINRFRSLTSNEQQCIDLTIKTFLENEKSGRIFVCVRSFIQF